jgi:carboxylate-amine ligase
MQTSHEHFRFGIEAEYVLVDSQSFAPLWYQDLDFHRLNAILESVDVSGCPPLDGLKLDPPHRKRMPFAVEGYHLPQQDEDARDILPKGVEIRTPVCGSLDECLRVFAELYSRMTGALAREGYAPVAISHHPVAVRFSGPQNKRQRDRWRWAMGAMTTYGPDMNVSLPRDLSARFCLADFEARLDHYAAAMTAFSLASPFLGGEPWQINGGIGKSVRTYRRSVVAPPLEVHPHEAGRIELKIFEMPSRHEDFEAFFLLFLTLLLDDRLTARAEAADRIYEMGGVAQHGFLYGQIRAKCAALLESALRTLPPLGFGISPLNEMARRLDLRLTPADAMLDVYHRTGRIEDVLRSLGGGA